MIYRAVLYLFPLLVTVSQADQKLDSIDKITLPDSVEVLNALTASDDDSAANYAYRVLLNLYVEMGEVEEADSILEVLKTKVESDEDAFRDAYGHGFAVLFDYYANVVGDEATAEIYAKRLTSELGTTKPIDEIYYQRKFGIISELPDSIRAMINLTKSADLTEAAQAYKGLIRYYLLTENSEKAASILEEVKGRTVILNQESFWGTYFYGFLLLYAYYLDNDSLAEDAEEVPPQPATSINGLMIEGKITSDGIPYMKEAIEDIKKLNPKASILPDLYYSLADYYFNNDQYKNAGKLSVEFIYQCGEDCDDPRLPAMYLLTGQCYERLEDYGSALDVYISLSDEFPYSLEALEGSYRILDILIEAGEIDRVSARLGHPYTSPSREPCFKVIPDSLIPAYRELHGYGLAALFDYYYGRGEEEETKKYVRTMALALGTVEPLIDYYQEREDSVEIDIYTEFVRYVKEIPNMESHQIHSSLHGPVVESAHRLYEVGRYEDAAEVFMVLKNWPRPWDVRDMLSCCVMYKLALTYYRLERYEEAEAEINDWIALYYDSTYAPQYYYLLGQCYEELNTYGDALDAYSYIMDHHPEHPVSGKAARRIIFILLMAGEVDRARAKVEETKALMTRYPEIYKDTYGYGLLMIFLYYLCIDDELTDWHVYETYSEGKINLTISSITFLQDMIADLNEHQFQLCAVPQLSLILADLLMKDERYEEAKEALLVIKNWEDAKYVAPVMTKVDRMIAECEERMGAQE